MRYYYKRNCVLLKTKTLTPGGNFIKNTIKSGHAGTPSERFSSRGLFQKMLSLTPPGFVFLNNI
jgi:hypothetical protein